MLYYWSPMGTVLERRLYNWTAGVAQTIIPRTHKLTWLWSLDYAHQLFSNGSGLRKTGCSPTWFSFEWRVLTGSLVEHSLEMSRALFQLVSSSFRYGMHNWFFYLMRLFSLKFQLLTISILNYQVTLFSDSWRMICLFAVYFVQNSRTGFDGTYRSSQKDSQGWLNNGADRGSPRFCQ